MPIPRFLPELEAEEAQFIYNLTQDLSDQKAELFASVYRARRKDPTLIIILTLVGFFGIAGIHRIYMGKPVSGVIYLLTLGLCFIGTIVDLLNFKGLTFEHNSGVALEIFRNL